MIRKKQRMLLPKQPASRSAYDGQNPRNRDEILPQNPAWIIHRVYPRGARSLHVDSIALTVSIAEQDTIGIVQLFEKRYVYTEAIENIRYIELPVRIREK